MKIIINKNIVKRKLANIAKEKNIPNIKCMKIGIEHVVRRIVKILKSRY